MSALINSNKKTTMLLDIGVEINYALPKTPRDVALLRLYIFSTLLF
jgi:hypothetical protein